MTLLFFALPLMRVLSTHGHKCHLPPFTMKALERQGDILIGGLFPLHLHTSSRTVMIPFTGTPTPTYCQKSIQPQESLSSSPSNSPGSAHGNISSYTSSLSFWFYKYIQTMIFAIEEINQNPSLLPNVTLGFQIFDSCETVSRALLGTMQFLTGRQKAIPNFRCRNQSPQAGIIGEAGITESRMIARVLNLYRYSQISYFDTGPVTNEGSESPSFFRSVPSNKLQAHGLAQLVIHFGWKWVGLLAGDSEYGKQGIDIVQEEIVQRRVCVAFSHLLPSLPKAAQTMSIVKAIAESRARVVVTFCGVEALPILIQLYEVRVIGKVWLCSGAISHISIYRNEKISQMLTGSLIISTHKEQVPGLREFLLHLHPSSQDVFTQEFWSKVFNCWWNPSSVEGESVARQCTGKENLGNGTNAFLNMPGFGMSFNIHNAVYAIAHSLHIMAEEERRGPKAFLNKMQASPWKLFQYLRKVHFKNKMGENISFDEYGDPPAVFDVFNMNFSNAVHVGQITFSISGAEDLKMNDMAIRWAGGGIETPNSVCTPSCRPGYRKSHRSGEATCCFDCMRCAKGEISNQTDSAICSRCPEDQRPDKGRARCVLKRELFLSLHEPLGAALASSSVCGALLPVLILTIFVAHRETPLVRANSRELSYLLLVGLTLGFLCCLLFLGRPTPYTCLFRQVVFGLTFALCLSCLLAKTLIVVSAFRATCPNSRAKVLLGSSVPQAIVVSGCLPQIVLCVVWLAVTPPSFQRDTHSLPHAIKLLCDEGSPVAFWSMLAYLCLLGGLTLVGAFLARNLPDAFNEAWLICFSLLGCLAVWLAFIPAYLTARERDMAATEAFAILCSSAALLSGMFLPKCYILLLHPEMNTRGYLMRRGQKPYI